MQWITNYILCPTDFLGNPQPSQIEVEKENLHAVLESGWRFILGEQLERLERRGKHDEDDDDEDEDEC